jgi:hypothetical protein
MIGHRSAGLIASLGSAQAGGMSGGRSPQRGNYCLGNRRLSVPPKGAAMKLSP